MMKLFTTVVLLAGWLVALSGVGHADTLTTLASASMQSGDPAFLEVKCAVTNLYNRPITANIYIIDSDGNLCKPDLVGSKYCTETDASGFSVCNIPERAIGWVNCANGRNDYCEVTTSAPQGTVLGSFTEFLDATPRPALGVEETLPVTVMDGTLDGTLSALELHPVSGPIASVP